MMSRSIECDEYKVRDGKGVCAVLRSCITCRNPGRFCCHECSFYASCEHEDKCTVDANEVVRYTAPLQGRY